jgi:glycosyltransferase involved in cell wall biosynthesis
MKKNPKLHVICVAYERPLKLRIFIDCLLVQTDQNWQLYIVHDGPPSKEMWNMLKLFGITQKNRVTKDDKIEFCYSVERYHSDKKQTWGHPNRRAMLNQLEGNNHDFILITNDDNYYVPTYVETMLSAVADDIGIIYCDCVHSHVQYQTFHILRCPAELRVKGIDMGAFMVRFDIAKKTGFNHDDFTADGMYAEECYTACRIKGLDTVYVHKLLYVHN